MEERGKRLKKNSTGTIVNMDWRNKHWNTGTGRLAGNFMLDRMDRNNGDEIEEIEEKVKEFERKEEDDQKVAVMRKAFQMFDTTKSGFIETMKISTILNTMGQLFDDGELNTLIEENDPEGSGKVNFDGFCKIAGRFLEEEDAEAMQEELKEAFRLYDREGNGYITTATLKEILAALDDKLTSSDLDGIIAEIDTDGSGTVDFDEFMEMMTGE
ncbi:PREDICTED: troponin C [Atta cephalotes]|uniref:EF-hand domain-containing protein n=2 Tax=Attini TaxID=143999 RepID=A0A158NSR4_ATTCE|nr:PREDICTED: troponin C [Atta cephalotes]